MLRKPSLPLPEGYFGTSEPSDEQRSKFRALVRTRLAQTLADEHAFVHRANRQIDLSNWRLVKRKHRLQIYRRRFATVTAAEDTSRPSMRSVGRIDGTIEDVLYGAYSKTHDELHATIAFAGKTTRDCTVLQTLELATRDDPFHYVGLQWLYSDLPLVKPRDWCVLHALGLEYDTNGDKFGFIVVQSVDVPQCPPFDRRAVVRGHAQFVFVLRESVAGTVDVFAQALFDPAGELIQRFSTSMTTSVLTGVLRLAQCAEAKKLTVLALRYKQLVAVTNDDSIASSSCTQCDRTGSYFSALKRCGVCRVTVCTHCSVRKPVFIGPQHAVYNVPCCHVCVTKARTMVIRPADASCSIVPDHQLTRDQFSTLDSSASSPRRRDSFDGVTNTDHSVEHDDRYLSQRDTTDSVDDLSELDVNLYRFSDESGLSEDDVEKLIAALAAESIAVSTADSKVTAKSESEPVDSITSRSIDSSSTDSSPAVVVAPAQLEMYRKILALQSAANETFSLTQANSEMMRSLQ